MIDCVAATPRYVLRQGLLPLGPLVLPTVAQADVTVVFAFSSKPHFDAFLRQSEKKLTPYPLVKGFLQNQSDLDGKVLRLVVIDANSPHQTILHAATVQAVLNAFELNQTSVLTSHELIIDEKLGSYRIPLPVLETNSE